MRQGVHFGLNCFRLCSGVYNRRILEKKKKNGRKTLAKRRILEKFIFLPKPTFFFSSEIQHPF